MGSIEPMAAHIQYVYVSSYIMRIKYVQIDEKKFILDEYPHSNERVYYMLLCAIMYVYTVGTVSITNTKSVTNGRFATVCTVKKVCFDFFFFIIIFKEFIYRNKKKFKNNFLVVKKNLNNFTSLFFSAVFFGGEKFSPNFKPFSNRPLYTNA